MSEKGYKALGVGAAILATLALIVGVYALSVANAADIESMGLHPGGTTTVDGTLSAEDLAATDDLTVGDDLTVTGDSTLTGEVVHGAAQLYILGHASTSKEIVCGTTGVFTDSTDLVVSALSTIDGIVVTQITAPAATAMLPHVTAVDGYTATVKTVESDYTAGTTGANLYYCAVGTR